MSRLTCKLLPSDRCLSLHFQSSFSPSSPCLPFRPCLRGDDFATLLCYREGINISLSSSSSSFFIVIDDEKCVEERETRGICCGGQFERCARFGAIYAWPICLISRRAIIYKASRCKINFRPQLLSQTFLFLVASSLMP